MMMADQEDLFSARRVHGVLSIHAQKAKPKQLEPKRSQYADVMNDYNTSATALHLAARLGALQGCT